MSWASDPSSGLARPGYAPVRSPMDIRALAVVVILSALFAAAILAALQSHPLPDAMQAAVEGGL